MPQYNVLRILRGAGESVSMGEVKQRMLFASSDLSRLMDRLVGKGFADRNLCPSNRRKMDVCISSEGLQILKEIDKCMRKELNSFFADALSEEEVEAARQHLAQLRADVQVSIQTLNT